MGAFSPSLLINTIITHKKSPQSPSGRTPAGEANYTGGFAAIVSDYMTSREAFHTSLAPFRRIRGGGKSWCPSVCASVGHTFFCAQDIISKEESVWVRVFFNR